MSLSPVEQWRADFAQDPLTAIEKLLLGRVYMGNLHRNEVSEILFRIFNAESLEVQHTLDGAMRAWFDANWLLPPRSLSSSRWAEILQNAFFTVYRLNLTATEQWLADSYSRGYAWLRSLYLTPARDPEAVLLRTLALTQKDQTLLPRWMRLCGMEEELPRHYSSIGLLGLRKMPEKDGTPADDIHGAVFKGIVDLAGALYAQVKPHKRKEAEQFWFLECKSIMALYPRSSRYWLDRFVPLIQQKRSRREAKLLEKVIPGFSNRIRISQLSGVRQPSYFIQPPSLATFKRTLELIENHPLEQIRSELDVFLDKHRRYAQQTGDLSFLAKTLCNVTDRIYKQDVKLATGLLKEAFLWTSYKAYAWMQLAKVEAYQGNLIAAAALLWEAKRKFPEDPSIRYYLANIVQKQGEHRTAEKISRQTIIDFPEDVVCRIGLARVLLQAGKKNESISIIEETEKEFPDNRMIKSFSEKIKTEKDIDDNAVLTDYPSQETQKPLQEQIDCAKEITGQHLDETGTEVGMINLYRISSRWMKGEEKIQLQQDVNTAFDKVLSKVPNNIPALLEKSWWLIDQQAENAEDFIAEQIKWHPNVLGFHLAEIRLKSAKEETTATEQWRQLSGNYASKKTIIKLEHALQDLANDRKEKINTLESLIKRFDRSIEQLPASTQNNEKWTLYTVKQHLFETINIDKPLTENDVPQILSNFRKHENVLKGIVEQCVATI